MCTSEPDSVFDLRQLSGLIILDRLGRRLTHLELILDEMSRLRVPLVCTSQGIDTNDDNPAGKFQLGVLMAVAESVMDSEFRALAAS